MESKFLANIHVLKESNNSSFANDTKGIVWSYLYDPEFNNSTEDLCKFLFSGYINRPFTIYYSPSKSCTHPVNSFEILYLILCHPSYFKINNNHVLFIDHKRLGEGYSSFINILVGCLKQQGFYNTIIVDSDDMNLVNNTYPFYHLSSDVTENIFFDWYLNILTYCDFVPNIFIRECFLEQSLLLIESFDERLKDEKFVLWNLLVRLKEKNNFIEKSSNEFDLLKQELTSKSSYLDFLTGKSNRQIVKFSSREMQIKEFYYWEYEVLPKWYKRFGHILKVLMGKRTFYSLFNDNVKKYKD